MDYLPTNPRCALCGVPASRYAKEELVGRKTRSVRVKWLKDVIILTKNPTTKTVFLIKEAKIQFTGFHRYEISAKSDAYEGLFPDGKVRVYDDASLTNVLSFPLHRACYEVAEDLAPPGLHNYVLNRLLYETLHAHYMLREDKEKLPMDVQLQHDFLTQSYPGPYGLKDQNFDQKLDSVIDFAFYDPNNISAQERERIINDLQSLGERMFRDMELPKNPLADRNGNVLSHAKFWKNEFYADLSWAAGWFSKKSTRAVEDWYEFYSTMDSIGKYGHISVPDSKRLMNRYRVAQLCGKVLKEGCATATSLLPTQAELASQNKSGTRVYGRTFSLNPSQADFVPGQSFTAQAPSQQLNPLQAEFVPGQSNVHEVLTAALPGYMPEVAWFDPNVPATSGAIGLLPKFDNAIDAKPAIKIFWTEDMVLAGIGMAYELGQMEMVIGSPETFHTSQFIVIPEDDWLCGLTLTTRESPEFENGPLQRRVVGIEFNFFEAKRLVRGDVKGEKRVFVPQTDSFIVGLVCVWNPGKPLHMLGLLEQPLDKAPIEASTYRLNPAVRSPAQKLHITDPVAANFLWARSVPGSNLRLSPCYPHQPDPHLITEHLLFNFDTPEDHGVYKLGIEAQLRFFHVSFLHSKAQHIYFGKGEVIVQCYVTGVKRVEGVRLTTTRGRQIIIGKNGPDAKPLVDQDKRQCVMGFYCTWNHRGTNWATLVSFGVFTRDGVIPPEYVIKDTEVDSHNYPWYPSGPAQKPSMQEFDPIYGLITTPSQTTVAWLDCTKPIKTVKVNVCHKTSNPGLPIISITHFFANESKPSEFGPTYVRNEKSSSVTEGFWCHCAYGGSPISELFARSDYTTETWEVGDSRLKAIRLWMNPERVLTGLQYVAENDRTSPAWGACPSECSVEVELPHTYRTGPALKFFLGSDERNGYGVDFVVVAVQLLSVAMRHKNKKISRTERDERPLDLEEVELEMMRMQLEYERELMMEPGQRIDDEP